MMTIRTYLYELINLEASEIWIGLIDPFGNELLSNSEISEAIHVEYKDLIEALLKLIKMEKVEKEEVFNDTGQHELLTFEYADVIEVLKQESK